MNMSESIVLYGKIDTSPSSLIRLYSFGKDIFHASGLELTHLGIVGGSFNGGKITTYKRTEKRLVESIKNQEIISAIMLYSLPDNFNQAAFDYEMTFSINTRKDEHFIHLCFLSRVSEKVNRSEVISKLKEFIEITSGVVFQMGVTDAPYFYAAKVNPPSSFPSLKIIQKLEH
ncbi:hypothetical protein LJR153_003424 [Paenibacillus sp. LjRoot153]|uniref:hypothetical protein n=1 Tax=Paenibacillus sp. LjRoot153 TaxID=3342270 RepID=UPI003ECCDF2E